MHIQMPDKGLTKQIFDKLEKDTEDIEASMDLGPGQEWHWCRHPRFTFSSINIRKAGTIYDPREKLEDTRTWMLCLLPKFKKIFEPRLEILLQELQGDG